MRKLVALLLVLCMMCSVVTAEMPTWPEGGVVLGNTGLSILLPDGIPAAEITEELREGGVFAHAYVESSDAAGGFTLLVSELAESPESIHNTLVAELEAIAEILGIKVLTSRDDMHWILNVAADGDAVYMRKDSISIGEATIDYIQGDTYSGSRFVFAGIGDGEKTFYLKISMNSEYAQMLPDVLNLILQPNE